MTMIQLIACIGMIAGLFMVLHVSPRELSDSLFSCLTAAPGSIRADINETTKRKKAGYPWQYQIPHRGRWAARYSQMGHRQENQADLCPCALQGQRMAPRTESPHGAGIDPRLQGENTGAHRTGRQ